MSRLACSTTALAAILAAAVALPAHAQTMAYGDVGSSDDAAAAGDDADADAPRARSGGNRRVTVTPYIEAALVGAAELSPGNETLTYSTIAAGVDASIQGRNNQGAVSLRYERRIGLSGNTSDGDAISGVARFATTVVPQAVQIEAGALAARTRVEGNGAAVLGPLDQGDAVSQVYSVYAGPSVRTNAGDVAINGSYRIGYSRVESPDAIVTAPGQEPLDVFDDSVVHSAAIHASTRPGDVLPVGIGIGAGYNREDISNLDQRIEDFSARADVTLPVSSDLALVAGVGYEDVTISSRDAVRDGSGNPVIGPDGRYVTDGSAPRSIAYDTSGFIWDVGVIWRPSRRTALEAHFGRRYGSDTFYGSFAWAPNSRSSLNISVYDNISGFGGQVNSALAALPTDFEAARNPLTGDLTGCLVSLEDGNCLSGALGSVRSSTFRARGVMASYGVALGRLSAGIGLGYDRRKFLAAPGTVLASANGLVDENLWVSAYLNGRIDSRSSFRTNVYANWFQSGYALAGDASALGANAAYNRLITNQLSAYAALGIDGISRERLEDIWTASALVGLRYSF